MGQGAQHLHRRADGVVPEAAEPGHERQDGGEGRPEGEADGHALEGGEHGFGQQPAAGVLHGALEDLQG